MEFRSGDESAVYSINTPMMVEAPAGSGKTTLLVDKYIAMLIYLTAFRNKSAFDAVKEITALTFTRKAAEEMKDRIRKKIGENFTPAYLDYAVGMINIHETGGSPVPSEPAGMTAAILAQKETLSGAISSASISTIHSFALNILKTHPVETMLDPASSPRGEEISGGDVFITARDALYSSLRKQIDTGSPDLSALIGILGFEKTEEMLEALLVASDSYGYNAVMEMAAAGGYLEYKDGISEREWLSKKVKPELMSLLSGLAAVRPDVGKTGLPALEKTIQKIESAILKDSAPDFFHADFYYPGRSGPVKTVSDALYARVYSEMHRYVFQHLWKVFRHVLAGYGNLKRERKEISFSDIELILLETLKKDRIFTADVKKNKSYILIDEYQDTSDVQKEIFDALIYDEKGGLSMIPFIVGDPKQSIYGFRNANIEIFGKTKQELLKFREKYQTPVYRELDRNFRSGKKLLDDFNEIFADVFNNEKTEYRPSVTAGPACCSAGTAGTGSMGPQGVYFVRSEESHADEMMASASRKAACIIAGLVGSHGYRPGEILVLVRKKTRLPLLRECFDDILGRRGIPYFHVDSSNILDTKEIQDIIIYLQALENPHSNYYFLPLLKSPFFRKSDPEIISFLRDGQSLYDVLNSAGASAEMDLFNRIRLKKNRISISDLAGEIIERSGYFSFLSSLPCKKEATTNVLVFTDYLRRLQEMEMFNLTDLLYYIQEYGVSLSKPRVIGEKSDVVRVMTVHSSKGLESRAVIYLASSPGEGDPGAVIFSGSGSKAGMGMKLVKPDTNYFALAEDLKDAGAREEKRLAYVTFTRARELFYYIGIDGNDGWKSFINTDKVFAAKRCAVIDEILQDPVLLKDDKETAVRAEKQYRLLKKKTVQEDYSSFPRVITVTQLLDMEFLEKAFKMRYIEKSFPVDEALREIASSEEITARGAAAAEEGTFLHRIFQSASKENYREFIDSALSMESGGLEKDRNKIIEAAGNFYGSGFYSKYYCEGFERKTEWEINYNFMFGQRPVLIKAVLDLYLRGKDGAGIIADFKLKYKPESARYARQLNYYAYFLNELGYPADELYIYDIGGGGEVAVPKETGSMDEIIRKNLERIRDVYKMSLSGNIITI